MMITILRYTVNEIMTFVRQITKKRAMMEGDPLMLRGHLPI